MCGLSAVLLCTAAESTTLVAYCLELAPGIPTFPAASDTLLPCLQVVAHLQHILLAQAFSAWVDFARQQSSTEGHVQQMAASALARMRNLLLAQAFEASQAPCKGLHALTADLPASVKALHPGHGCLACTCPRKHVSLAPCSTLPLPVARARAKQGHPADDASASTRLQTWQEAAAARQSGRAQAEGKLAVLAGRTRFTADHRQAALLQKTVTGGPTAALAAAFCAWLESVQVRGCPGHGLCPVAPMTSRRRTAHSDGHLISMHCAAHLVQTAWDRSMPCTA